MIKLFNTASRRLEVFKPTDTRVGVKLYSCGPTVYDYPHLGNLRAYVFVDLLVRVLEQIGQFRVHWVMNITDIDDKTILAAQKAGVSLNEITRPLEKLFFQELEVLNVAVGKIQKLRATEHFPEMLKLLNVLAKKGIAYQAADGSWYFSIKKFKNYGKFARLKQARLKPGARVAQDTYTKETPADFALWKTNPAFKEGRPGWHIECSAMAVKYLGQPLDIHTGGVDLIFPHHQNEIAQTEAATGKPLARFWLHNEHLLIKGNKMAKSEGNVIYLKDLLKDFSPAAIRYFLLSAHYRSKLDFTPLSLKEAKETLSSIKRFGWKAKKLTGDFGLIKNFDQILSDDLNTPKALAFLHSNLKKAGSDFFDHINQTLGFNIPFKKDYPAPKLNEIEKALNEREKIRRAGNFKHADKLRKELEKKYSIEILDTNKGPKFYPI